MSDGEEAGKEDRSGFGLSDGDVAGEEDDGGFGLFDEEDDGFAESFGTSEKNAGFADKASEDGRYDGLVGECLGLVGEYEGPVGEYVGLSGSSSSSSTSDPPSLPLGTPTLSSRFVLCRDLTF